MRSSKPRAKQAKSHKSKLYQQVLREKRLIKRTKRADQP